MFSPIFFSKILRCLPRDKVHDDVSITPTCRQIRSDRIRC